MEPKLFKICDQAGLRRAFFEAPGTNCDLRVNEYTALDQPSQHYQHCRQTQNCHCEKYHRVGRHLCQKLDHLPLLGDLGRSVGVVKAVRQS
jgi:hypothetical protein